jgi:hypothetical protein
VTITILVRRRQQQEGQGNDDDGKEKTRVHTRAADAVARGERNEEELAGEATKVGGRQKNHGGGGGRKTQISIGNGALIGIHAPPTRGTSCNDAPSRC